MLEIKFSPSLWEKKKLVILAGDPDFNLSKLVIESFGHSFVKKKFIKGTAHPSIESFFHLTDPDPEYLFLDLGAIWKDGLPIVDWSWIHTTLQAFAVSSVMVYAPNRDDVYSDSVLKLALNYGVENFIGVGLDHSEDQIRELFAKVAPQMTASIITADKSGKGFKLSDETKRSLKSQILSLSEKAAPRPDPAENLFFKAHSISPFGMYAGTYST
jgi:hypothetical protein